MTDRRSGTRRTAAALKDIDAIYDRLDWLAQHIGDLDVIAHSKAHDPAEQVHTSPRKVDTGPVLSEMGQRAARDQIRTVCADIKAMRVDATALVVGLEALFSGPGADRSKLGTMLEPGELAAAKAAQARRVEHEGDPRWGEWEAQQPA